MDLPNVEWLNRAHFFAISARLLRPILIDDARKHKASKRGGFDVKIAFEDAWSSRARHVDLVGLVQALNRLSAIDAQQVKSWS
jgi:hypothetical protein